MSHDFALRPATADDLPHVLALIRELAAFEKLAGPDDDAGRRLAADFAATPRPFELLVATDGGAVVAYALYVFTYSTFQARRTLWLEDLYVRPSVRSRGLGAALLGRLAAVAVERGCGRFEWSVLDWNVRAQEFYTRLGARLLPEWRICRVDGAALRSLASPAAP